MSVGRMHALLLSLISTLLLSLTNGVDRDNFKTCDQSAFCKWVLAVFFMFHFVQQFSDLQIIPHTQIKFNYCNNILVIIAEFKSFKYMLVAYLMYYVTLLTSKVNLMIHRYTLA